MFCLLFCCFIALLLAELWAKQVELPPCREFARTNGSTVVNYWEPQNVTIQYGNSGDYKLLRRLGRGSFGEAYLGVNALYDLPVVIKIFIPNKSALIKMVREIFLLQAACGGPNIMRLYDVIHERSGNPALVFEYIDSNDADIDDLYKSLSLADIKFYMRELLIALRYLHGAKIIHRDVKPHNVLIDQSRRSLRLIDFGLSVFHTPDADQSIAGSKAYEAPELLVSHHRYDTKVDMWSTGAMLAALTFRRFPMFVGVKSENVLGQIVKVLGSEGLVELKRQYGQDVNTSDPLYTTKAANNGLRSLITDHNAPYVNEESLDLVKKLLQWNPRDRYSAEEALQHPFFTGV